MIVQIEIITEDRGDKAKQNRMSFSRGLSECNPKAAQQGVKMLRHVSEKDTNAPKMKRALKTWQGNVNNTYPM